MFTCLACGAAFHIERRRGSAPKWCRPCRRTHRSLRVCIRCGKPGVRADARYCSRSCAWPKHLPVLVGPPLYCDLPKTHPAYPRPVREPKGPRPWWKLIVAGPCGWCETYMVRPATSAETAPRYCSKQCARQATKYRRGRFLITPSKRRSIYERDGWTCQLCGDPVDRNLPPSDPWGATLDHIVCQSWTNVPDHSPENLRLAHRWCNSVRGDESHYTPDLLAA